MGVGAELARFPAAVLGSGGASLCLLCEMIVSITTLQKLYLFLFLAGLGVRRWVQAFSGCSEQGLLSALGVWAFHCSGLSCFGAGALGCKGLQEL